MFLSSLVVVVVLMKLAGAALFLRYSSETNQISARLALDLYKPVAQRFGGGCAPTLAPSAHAVRHVPCLGR